MSTPDRLSLTLQRIEGFLALLRIEDFGPDAEGGKRVIDDLHFLHRELKAGSKTLPLPRRERRPLDIAYGYDGHFGGLFSELHDRAIDLLDLFKASQWPLPPWQAAPAGDPIEDEIELRTLYAKLRITLTERRIDDLMMILAPALKGNSLAMGRNEDFEVIGERRYIEKLMARPDYRSEAPSAEIPVIRPMFDGTRVRLLDPEGKRHALGISPYTASTPIYAIQCQFGRLDGRWAVVGYD